MYIVYYNCYFYKYLKNVVPKWVVTDIQAHNHQLIKTPNKTFNLITNKSMLQTATSFNKLTDKKIHTEVRDFDMTTSIVIQKSQEH